MQDLITQLRKRLTGEVRFDDMSRALYSSDASIYEVEPVGVVIPKTTEDIQATVEIARENGVPIIARGGGTSIVGNSIGAGIILDCSKYLNGILEVNREEKWARVRPGVVLDELNAHLKPFELMFGPDVAPSNRANLGGMVGNNSSGAHSITHGKTVDHVQEMKVVLADGEEVELTSLSDDGWQAKVRSNGSLNTIYAKIDDIVQRHRDEIDSRFPKILRRVAGYNLDEFVRKHHNNLARLIVGSEGTLGIVSEMKINLVPRPQHSVLGVVHFDDLFSALEAVQPILEFKPAAVELVDDNIIDATRGTQELARRLTFVEGRPAALLLVEFQGDAKQELEDRLDKLAQFLQKQKIGYACYRAMTPEAQTDVWTIRKAGLGLLMGTQADRKPVGFVEDSAVPPERLTEYIRRFDDIVREHGTEASYYAHASVGCLHIRPKLNLRDPADVQHMAEIADEISSLVMEFGGTISGEHGDGRAHSCWNEKMYGPKLYQAFREVKHAFDPQNILNPGQIVDAPALTENLRSVPQREHIELMFDYSAEGGFDKAVEACNGNALCRKKDTGTMCPSFMVTLEEEHSTRGRANALRAIFSGRLSKEEFTSDRLHEVMDLCIGCKGCKGECPANVDMAKLKYEFLHHYQRANGLPLRSRVFGHIAAMNRLVARFPRLSNRVMGSEVSRKLLNPMIGVHAQRMLPPVARQTFTEWFEKRANRQRSDQKVVLFNDTFMTYNYPEIGKALVQVLEAAGFEVLLAEKKCCGRPLISKGMLREAHEFAKFNVERLHHFAAQGIPIVGTEPSCILSFRDEYPDLVQDSRTQAVAEHTFLVEEFLEQQQEAGNLNLPLKPAAAKFLLHGHCHLKALVGTKPTESLLGMIPDAELEIVDSGCCGMAGSFGFEKEHYDISMAMGRRKLFPAVEAKGDGWQVVAPGVSCRQQIEHGTGRKVRHPVEVLAEHLTS